MSPNPISEALLSIRFDHHPTLYIRWNLVEPDMWLQLVDKELPAEFNSGRKWRLSRHMTISEVVGTAFKAYTTWLEHEARESFRYFGRAVYSPHLSVDRLWELCGEPDALDVREEG